MELLPFLGFIAVAMLTLNYLASKIYGVQRKARVQEGEGWVEIAPTPAPPSSKKGKEDESEIPPASWALKIEGKEVVLSRGEEVRRFSSAREFARFLRNLPPDAEIRVPEKLPPVVTAILEAATHIRLKPGG